MKFFASIFPLLFMALECHANIATADIPSRSTALETITESHPVVKRQGQRQNYNVALGVVGVIGWGAYQGRKSLDEIGASCNNADKDAYNCAGAWIENVAKFAASQIPALGWGKAVSAVNWGGNTFVQYWTHDAGQGSSKRGISGRSTGRTTGHTVVTNGTGTNDADLDIGSPSFNVDKMMSVMKTNNATAATFGTKPHEMVSQASCQDGGVVEHVNWAQTQWQSGYGLKMECKNACLVGVWNDHDVEAVLHTYARTMAYSPYDLHEFTLTTNGQVMLRCRLDVETGFVNACPDLIDGSGCSV